MAPSEGAVPPPDADAATVALPAPPPRVLPVVAPSAVGPALAATRVAPATAPDPARVLAPAAGVVTPRGPVTPADPVAASGSGGSVQGSAPASAPPAATPPVGAPGQVAGADPISASPRADSDAALPSGHHSLGASRRLGLGAPLAGRPSVQRVAAGPDLPLVRAGRAPVPAAAAPAQAPPVRRAAAAATTLPVLRVASDAGRPAVSDGPGHDRSGRQTTGAPAGSVPRRPGRTSTSTPGRPRGPRRIPIDRWSATRSAGSSRASWTDADVEAGSDPVGPGVGAPGEVPVPAGTLSPVTDGAGPRSSAAPAAAPVSVSRSAIQPAPNHPSAPAPTASAARAAPLVVGALPARQRPVPIRPPGPAGRPGLRDGSQSAERAAGSAHVTTAAPATHAGARLVRGRRTGVRHAGRASRLPPAGCPSTAARPSRSPSRSPASPTPAVLLRRPPGVLGLERRAGGFAARTPAGGPAPSSSGPSRSTR